MISLKKNLSITRLTPQTGGKALVGTSYSNSEITTGFYFRELGVFANDPDLGEILYCYGNAGSAADYIPPGGGADVVESHIVVTVLTGNAANVSAVIDGSLVFVTTQEFEAALGDMASLPTTAKNTAGAISELFTSVSDGKEILAAAITGKGIPTAADDTFEEMANNIGGIVLGSGNAQPADVLSGKTFSNDSGPGKVGTMQNRGAVNILPGTANQTVQQGYHNGAGIVQGDADLISANIKAGVNIFGVVGNPNVVNTAEATAPATAAQIFTGRKAFVNGAAVTGTMVDRTAGGADVAGTAVGSQPGKVFIQAPQGYYNGGNAVQYSDADFIAANIRSGVNVFGMEGTYGGEASINNTYNPASGYVPSVLDLVEFNTDGSAKKTAATYISGLMQSIQTTTTNQDNGDILYMEEDKGVILAALGLNTTTQQIIPFSIIAGTIQLGTPMVLPEPSYYGKLVRLGANLFAVMINVGVNGTNAHQIRFLLYSYVNGTLTYLSTPVLGEMSSATYDIYGSDIVSIAPGRFLCVFVYYLNSVPTYRTGAIAFTLNANNTVTPGPITLHVTSMSAPPQSIDVFALSDGSVISIVKPSSTTDSHHFIKWATNSSNVVTVAGGSSRSLGTSNSNRPAIAHKLSGDRIFYAGPGSTSNYTICDGASFTFSTSAVLDSNPVTTIDIAQLDSNDPDTILVTINHYSTTPTIKGLIVNIPPGATTVTIVSSNSLSIPTPAGAPGTGVANSYALQRMAPGKFMWLHTFGGSGSTTQWATLFKVVNNVFSGGVTDVQDPQGIVTAYSGGVVSVQFNNGIVSSWPTGLSAGTLIYCDEYGYPVSTVKEKPIGIVISSTEVFMFGLNSMNGVSTPTLGQVTRTHAVSGTATVGRVVKLNSNGTISNYDGTGVIYGIYQGSGVVLLSGVSKVHSGLRVSDKYYFDSAGIITNAVMSEKAFIGSPRSNTELLTNGFLLSKNYD
ncbi:hypothetical protein AB4Z33_16790 [Paenibacillus sp. 2TAB19]